jgi:predicted TIM-barrel fold metal-dependent hydrolase
MKIRPSQVRHRHREVVEIGRHGADPGFAATVELGHPVQVGFGAAHVDHQGHGWRPTA